MIPEKVIAKRKKADEEHIVDRRKQSDPMKQRIRDDIDDAFDSLESIDDPDAREAVESLADAVEELAHMDTGDDRFEQF